MKIIEKLSENIEDEIDDSKKYIKMALHNKEEHPELSGVFYELSVAEMGHMEMLHKQVTQLINKYKAEHGEPPAAMLAVYNFLHNKQIEKVAEIKVLQEQFKKM